MSRRRALRPQTSYTRQTSLPKIIKIYSLCPGDCLDRRMLENPQPSDGGRRHRLDKGTWLLGKIPSSSLASNVDASESDAVSPEAVSFPYAGRHCKGKIVRKESRSHTRTYGRQLERLLRAVHWLKQSNRQLHKQVLELRQLTITMHNDRLSSPMSCPISVSEPVFKQMVTREDFEQFETAVLDRDYRQKVTSYLCTLGGDKIVTFAQRIFASLFSDEITYHVTFFGRHQQKRPFFGSITYGIVLDVFSSWSADHKSDLYQLERAFRYSFKKAYDRLCKRGHR